MDLDVEHDNKYFKNDCHSYRGEFTEKTINRIGRSTERSNQIVMNFHQTTSAAKPSGVHSRLSTEGDVKALVEPCQAVKYYSKSFSDRSFLYLVPDLKGSKQVNSST